jgi:septum formation protein
LPTRWCPVVESGCSPLASPLLVLASASPRRRELLGRIVADFEVAAADIDESAVPGELPVDYVGRLALEKAMAVSAQYPGEVVLGADTTVVLDGSMIGKPADEGEARSVLGRLSGRAHTVLTGLALLRAGHPPSVRVGSTEVQFAQLGAAEIDWYVATGEPMGKAGAYALQGRGAVFVDRVDGDPTNVIGLPLNLAAQLLSAAGLTYWQL